MINSLQLNTHYTIPYVIISSKLVSLSDGETREGGEWTHLVHCCTPVSTTAHAMQTWISGVPTPPTCSCDSRTLWWRVGSCQAGCLLLWRQFGENSFQKKQLWLTQMNCKIVFGLKALLTEVSKGRRGGHEREAPRRGSRHPHFEQQTLAKCSPGPTLGSGH